MHGTAPAFITRTLWLWMALGILAVAYMALCPRQFHGTYGDFAAGVLVGLGLVAGFVRLAKT